MSVSALALCITRPRASTAFQGLSGRARAVAASAALRAPAQSILGRSWTAAGFVQVLPRRAASTTSHAHASTTTASGAPASDRRPRRALYAGTFDPPSCGHLDIVKRALGICDSLVIAVALNPSKRPIFSVEERVSLLLQMVAAECPDRAGDVEVVAFDGLIVDIAKQKEADFLVRGLRVLSDFDYELRMSLINRKLSGIETLFLMADERHTHISSTLIRELGRWKTTLPEFVPPSISSRVFAKLGVPYDPERGVYGVLPKAPAPPAAAAGAASSSAAAAAPAAAAAAAPAPLQ